MDEIFCGYLLGPFCKITFKFYVSLSVIYPNDLSIEESVILRSPTVRKLELSLNPVVCFSMEFYIPDPSAYVIKTIMCSWVIVL